MNAIVPLNITALRVNFNDTSIVNQFAGQMADFKSLAPPNVTTGDHVFRSLVEPKPNQPLDPGIHLHWELPDFFRQGAQSNDGGPVVFPRVPNRWMVVRHFSEWDGQKYLPAQSKCWIVESDFLSTDHSSDAYQKTRPCITVPIPPLPAFGKQPFRYMGRVLEYQFWEPDNATGDYLPNYTDPENASQPLFLTSVGFVGPSFSAYYPECCSVFGFWDHFADLNKVRDAIRSSDKNLKFKVAYQVIGWIQEANYDPLQRVPRYESSGKNLGQVFQDQYNKTVQQYHDEKADLNDLPTPVAVFNQLTARLYKWNFPEGSITVTQDATTKMLTSVTVPEHTLCNGILQEVVWDMAGASNTVFLKGNTGQNGSMWLDDEVKIAVGNTPTEALSALLKMEGGQADNPADLSNYEYLLDALQLGLLRDLEQQDHPVVNLDEALHSRGFSRLSGGQLWIVKSKQQDGVVQAASAASEVTLPLDLAEKLHDLNQAQKDYDQGRAALAAQRKQLFMDWFRYMNGTAGGTFYTQDLPNFLYKRGPCALKSVTDAGAATGILGYRRDANSGSVTEPVQPVPAGSLADAVFQKFQAVKTALGDFPDFELQCVPAPNFWAPTEPVVLVEGKMVEQARRNGDGPLTNVRTSGQLVTALQAGSVSAGVDPGGKLPPLNAKQPLADDVLNLLREAYLFIPALASFAAAALKAGGAAGDPDALAAAVQAAQGGWDSGLFKTLHDAATPVKNASVSVQQPLALQVTFTNAAQTAWTPDAVAWNAQKLYTELSPTRLDPYIPVFLTWKATFDPLKKDRPADASCIGGGANVTDAPNGYGPDNLKQYFQLDGEAIENEQRNGAQFNAGTPVPYSEAAILSRKATFSLSAQIDKYLQDNPTDPFKQQLSDLKDSYGHRSMLAQSLSGFNLQQVLRNTVPKVQVENLNKDIASNPLSDPTTANIQKAIDADAKNGDNWYDYGLNSEQPVFSGNQALYNFGPLRAGILEVMSLRFVDVFGQIMDLRTQNTHSGDSALQLFPSSRLPGVVDGDPNKLFKLFLPPRILPPSRLWFRWLSATHNTGASDFVEMNTHPSTSPVCGWLMPNHLDNSLMVYNNDGSPIGSFGLEHGALTYRTRPGNSGNQGDQLALDIGPPGKPAADINPHTANVMWFVQAKSAVKINPDGSLVQDAGSIQKGGLFLKDLMDTIEHSDQFIHSTNFKQADGLAVLVGRPLAITRAVLALETKGQILPLHQGDSNASSPFHQDVAQKRYAYKDREPCSSGGLGNVQFPLRLGNLSYTDDGLVGFLPEDANGQFAGGLFYSAAAPDGASNDVVKPAPDTLQLTLNAPQPQVVTLLMDPRCAVHATTGVLPVEEISIPPDQYAQILRRLAVTFFVHPVLEEKPGLLLPLPEVPGYEWSWIEMDSPQTVSVSPPLRTQAATDAAHASYSPQTILEGWLGLSERPEKQSS